MVNGAGSFYGNRRWMWLMELEAIYGNRKDTPPPPTVAGTWWGFHPKKTPLSNWRFYVMSASAAILPPVTIWSPYSGIFIPGLARTATGCRRPIVPWPATAPPPTVNLRGYIAFSFPHHVVIGRKVVSTLQCVVGSSPTRGTEHFGFPQSKGLGMSSLVYATGHIKDPVPLIEKRRGLSPGGRFPPSFIHQVIIITGLNKLYNCMFSP